jgi:hypothetical protein
VTALYAGLAAATATTLLWAGLAKLAARKPMSLELLSGLGVRHGLASAIAWATAPLELLLGAAVLSGAAPLVTSALAVGLGVAFLGVQVPALRRGLDAPCGCLGALDRGRVSRLSLLRAAAFLATAACALASADRTPLLRTPAASFPWTPLGVLGAAAVLASFLLLEEVAYFEQHRVRQLPNVSSEVA